MSALGDLAHVRRLVAAEAPDDEMSAGSLAWLKSLCRAAARSLPATGAGLSLMITGGPQGLAAASDDTCELIEELQFTCGEGPCLEAFASGRPILAPDLGGGPTLDRWPAYSPAVLAHGVGAVFAFPMQIGVARLGVLDVYRGQAGSLSGDAVDLALAFADVALLGLLDAQQSAGEGHHGDGVEQASTYRMEVYQAQGMVQIQLGVSSAEALLRLRAYAYAYDRRLSEVSRDIVARTLTFHQSDEPG